MQKKKCLTIVLDLTNAAVKTAFDEATSPVGAPEERRGKGVRGNDFMRIEENLKKAG